MKFTGILPVLAAASVLSACGNSGTVAPARTGTDAAEAACLAAVTGSFRSRGVRISSSEPTQAGTMVMLNSRDGSRWRCRATKDGRLEDLALA